MNSPERQGGDRAVLFEGQQKLAGLQVPQMNEPVGHAERDHVLGRALLHAGDGVGEVGRLRELVDKLGGVDVHNSDAAVGGGDDDLENVGLVEVFSNLKVYNSILNLLDSMSKDKLTLLK